MCWERCSSTKSLGCFFQVRDCPGIYWKRGCASILQNLQISKGKRTASQKRILSRWFHSMGGGKGGSWGPTKSRGLAWKNMYTHIVHFSMMCIYIYEYICVFTPVFWRCHGCTQPNISSRFGWFWDSNELEMDWGSSPLQSWNQQIQHHR